MHDIRPGKLSEVDHRSEIYLIIYFLLEEI